VVVGDGNGRVLLLRHVFHAEFPWGLPGGWLMANEDPSLGARRELREETGLAAETMKPIFIWHETRPPHLGIVFQTTLHPRPMTLSAEILEASWFQVDSLPETATPYAQKAVAAAFGLVADPSERRIKMSHGEQ
jgi:ADP-ribose pyrophosphatase YjhB (NUDIX family)